MNSLINPSFKEDVKDILKVFTKREIITKEGIRMYLDKKDFMNLSLFGFYEKRETEFIKQNIASEMICLDIGANIGYHTLLMAKLAKQVLAFEPFPDAYELLNKNLDLNLFMNVRTYPYALGDKNKIARLFIEQGNFGMNKLEGSGRFIDVEERTLDSFYKGRVDFVKIDVEGHELEVLKGMIKILKKYKPVIMLESIWASKRDLMNFFSQNDYKIDFLGTKTWIATDNKI